MYVLQTYENKFHPRSFNSGVRRGGGAPDKNSVVNRRNLVERRLFSHLASLRKETGAYNNLLAGQDRILARFHTLSFTVLPVSFEEKNLEESVHTYLM